jgi:hypothetical protein
MLNLLRNKARNVGQLDMWGVSRTENYAVCQAAHTATVTLPEVRYYREMARSRSVCCIRTVVFTAAKKDIAEKKRTEGRKRKTVYAPVSSNYRSLCFHVSSQSALITVWLELSKRPWSRPCKSLLAHSSRRPPSHLFWHYTNPWTSNMVVKYLNISK